MFVIGIAKSFANNFNNLALGSERPGAFLTFRPSSFLATLSWLITGRDSVIPQFDPSPFTSVKSLVRLTKKITYMIRRLLLVQKKVCFWINYNVIICFFFPRILLILVFAKSGTNMVVIKILFCNSNLRNYLVSKAYIKRSVTRLISFISFAD